MTEVGTTTKIIEERGQTIFSNPNLLSKEELVEYSLEFHDLLANVLMAGDDIDRRGDEYKALRYFFKDFANTIQIRGGNLDEFVRYIQFVQKTFMQSLKHEENIDFEQARDILLLVGNLFNDMQMDVFHVYLEEKEKTISAQQDELRETSTPITEIWDGVLTLPIIGTLDSSRTVSVMEKLLGRIEQERAKVVVMDVTGVLAMDSQVSHHLIQMIRAIGLMGSKAILTGIRPDIARALTSLNIDFGDVTTRSTLSEGLKEAFRILDIHVEHN